MPTWDDIKQQALDGDPTALTQLGPATVEYLAGGVAALTPSVDSSLTIPQQRALESFQSRANLIVDEARTLAVTDQPTLESASKFRQDLKAATDLFEALMRPEINRYHKAHKEALANLSKLLSPWVTADAIVKKAQDDYHTACRREREEAARRLEEMQRKVRDEALARELSEAEAAQSPAHIEQVLERVIAPPPVVPVVHTTVKAEGSSARLVHDFDLIDHQLIDPAFVMGAIAAEIGRLGRCDWLMTVIKREVTLRGKEAERVVGEGAIRYRDGMSTGVRRKKS